MTFHTDNYNVSPEYCFWENFSAEVVSNLIQFKLRASLNQQCIITIYSDVPI